jgi:hypothetical protein
MANMKKSPRNQQGQKPSSGSQDTAKRLREKAKTQQGTANRTRTLNKAQAASSKR